MADPKEKQPRLSCSMLSTTCMPVSSARHHYIADRKSRISVDFIWLHRSTAHIRRFSPHKEQASRRSGVMWYTTRSPQKTIGKWDHRRKSSLGATTASNKYIYIGHHMTWFLILVAAVRNYMCMYIYIICVCDWLYMCVIVCVCVRVSLFLSLSLPLQRLQVR